MASEHAGHRQRMRERFLRQGLDGFAPHEILELLLFYAIPQKNVNPLAHSLIDRFGSLHGVLEASVEELMKVDGMGEYAATLISLMEPIARKLEESRAEKLTQLSNHRMAEEHCLRLLHGLRHECFYAVCLNGQMQIIHNALIAQGTLSEVQAYPRLVLDAVLRHNAHAVVLCHNHPGGQLAPSQADIDATAELEAALGHIGVALADHIIVANGNTLSMSAYGFIRSTSAGVSQTQAASSAGEVRIAHAMAKNRRKAKE